MSDFIVFSLAETTFSDDLLQKQLYKQFDYLYLSSSGKKQATRRTKFVTDDLLKYYDRPLEDSVAFVGSIERYVKLVKVQK